MSSSSLRLSGERGSRSELTPELQRAASALRGRIRPIEFRLANVLFGPQLAFVEDTATFATALCTRRAGKSVGVGAWLLEGPIKTGAPSLYFTITRKEAKRIIWPVMLKMNREHRLGYTPNESELILKRDGVPSVFLMGVDSRDEIEKARGTGWGRVAGDEAQIFPAYVESMINDVLMPSFMDHDGKLRLIGTPGAVPVGFFHDATKNPKWKHHGWTVWENPHVPNARAKLEEVKDARGVTEDDPSIQREWFGRWVLDLDALVFKFQREKNVYTELPKCVQPWQHIIGVDLGFEDSDAIAVLGFNDERPEAYLREESVLPKQTITQLAERMAKLIAAYKPLAVVMDTGGLGKKIAEEMRSRYELPIKAAEKAQKFSHIEVLNDALRSGRFFVKASSKFASDSMLVEWDTEKSTNDKRVISDRYHSDICDAVLYAFRESLHWMHVPKVEKPEQGTPQAYEAQAREYLEQLEQEHENRKAEEAMWETNEWA